MMSSSTSPRFRCGVGRTELFELVKHLAACEVVVRQWCSSLNVGGVRTRAGRSSGEERFLDTFHSGGHRCCICRKASRIRPNPNCSRSSAVSDGARGTRTWRPHAVCRPSPRAAFDASKSRRGADCRAAQKQAGRSGLMASLIPRTAAALIRRLAPPPSKGDSLPALAAVPTPEIPSATAAAGALPPCPPRQGAGATSATQRRAAVVTPLAPERYKLQVTLSRETDRQAAACAGARPTYAAGWRHRPDPRSCRTTVRPSRAEQVARVVSTRLSAARVRARASSPGGREACRLAAR